MVRDEETLKIWKWAWLIWAIFILIVLLIPASSLRASDVPRVPHLDKVVHFVLFGVLYYLAAKAYKYQQSGSQKYKTLIYVLSYSIFTEFTQLYFDRSFEIFDIIANITGALTAHLFFNRK